MHVNNRKPNILQDKQSERDLRDRDNRGNLTAKRHLVPRKNYPYAGAKRKSKVETEQ